MAGCWHLGWSVLWGRRADLCRMATAPGMMGGVTWSNWGAEMLLRLL